MRKPPQRAIAIAEPKRERAARTVR
jgi:hypothetical protein